MVTPGKRGLLEEDVEEKREYMYWSDGIGGYCWGLNVMMEM